MQIDLDHVMFWMDAIRNSTDPHRTLESFWKGQLRSKRWLIEELTPFITEPMSIDIHGGWNGVLASMLFQSNIPVKTIRSLDIDPGCEEIARTMNKLEEISGKFRAVTANMCDARSDADVIINTSCEHLSQDEYEIWLSGLPQNSLIVLQGNDYKIEEHVRTADSLEEFLRQSDIDAEFSGEFELPLYTRYMIIGRKL
jgi:uncharacterized protein (DUF2235 family)